MRLSWPTKGAAVAVMRPVTPDAMARAVNTFRAKVGRGPRTIVLTPKGAVQLLRKMPSQGRTYKVDGEALGLMTVTLKGSRRPTRLLIESVLPHGWVILQR